MGTSPVDTDESRVSSILICNILLIVASTFAVCVRLYVRMRYVSIGWDDYFCVIGWVRISVQLTRSSTDNGLLIVGRDVCGVSHVCPQ